MRIAIASVGKEMESRVSDEGGRAPYYLIFADGELVEVWENPMRNGGGGAGFGVASVMAEKGVDKVVFDRGHCKYHGRLAAFAESAREAGLVF